ncbi:MAG: hypothetical protein ACRD0G_02915 [Acidimicrobiales bacterium]
MTGPVFSEPPRFNHVAMSVPADTLDADGREAICAFYSDVFGFQEYPQMTDDRKRLVLGAHTFEQFVYLIAEDAPMKAPRLDHFGLSVANKDEFDEVYRRAAVWRDKHPDEVDLIEPSYEDHFDVLRLHSFYVRYRLPLMVETQYFDWRNQPNVG